MSTVKTKAERAQEKQLEMYKHGVRPYDFINYESGKPRSASIPRDKLVKAIDLHFSGKVVITGASAGAVLADGVLKLIKSITISAKGSEQKWRIDARQLYFWNAITMKQLGTKTDPTAATNGTYNIALFLRVPFENHVGMNVADTFFDPRRFSTDPLVTIEWNPATSMFNAAFDGTAAIDSAYGITPVFHETTEWDDISFERRLDYSVHTVTSDKSYFKVELEPEGRIYQGIMFMTLDGDVRSGDIINKVSLDLSGGIHVYDRVDFDHIINQNKMESRLGSSFPTGIGYLNLLEQRGKISRGLNVSVPGIKTANFYLDVSEGSGTTEIVVLQDYLVN